MSLGLADNILFLILSQYILSILAGHEQHKHHCQGHYGGDEIAHDRFSVSIGPFPIKVTEDKADESHWGHSEQADHSADNSATARRVAYQPV